ncbi:MAG: transglutaminase family protein [Rhizobiaceae bacterium]|jgi:transglutaminase-like putative cysteine protease|nr:transglutaminase family protein [Rhizobiaceae bacterium]
MRLKITHETRYKYSEPVKYLLQQVRLTPKTDQNQTVADWEVTVEGGVREVEFSDQFNNHVILCSIDPHSSEIAITSRGEIDVEDKSGIIRERGGYAPLWLFRRPTSLTKPGKGIRQLTKGLEIVAGEEVKLLHELSARIHEQVQYEAGHTSAVTTAEEAISLEKGVCQDHAHIFLASVRHMGFPARYVSGYLMMNDRVEQDASHAWAEAHVPGLGWVGFDVSNGISPDDRYVRLATGLDYRNAAPVSGMRIGASTESMDVSLQVQQQ